MLVAYGISLWGAYICWEAEKEEKEVQDAWDTYRRNNPDYLAI